MSASLLCKPDNKYPCGLGNRVLEDRKAEAIEQGRPWMKRQGEQAKKPLRSTGETQASPSGDVSLGQDDLGCEDSDSWGCPPGPDSACLWRQLCCFQPVPGVILERLGTEP